MSSPNDESDHELREAVSRNEARAEWGGVAVVVGLVVEVVLTAVYRHGQSIIEAWGPVFADALIALGVAAEILFSRKARSKAEALQRRSDEKIAEANARAAESNRIATEAQLELAKLRSSRRADLTGKTALITERLKPFAGTPFDCGYNMNSGEQADFWWDLEPALVAAGWVHLPWSFPPMVGGILTGQASRPVSGSVAAQNVEIHLHVAHRERLLPAASALIAALSDAGIAVTDAGFNTATVNENAVHILIGDKR